MKVTVRKDVPGSKLREMVPPAYRDLVAEKVDKEDTYTLLLFPHAERDVVTSLPVRRAFRRLDPADGSTLLAVGTTFTEEALQILSAYDAAVVQLRTSKWTDASAAQRQL